MTSNISGENHKTEIAKEFQDSHILTRIVGVTYDDEETRTNRQSIISSMAKHGVLESGHLLNLKREPENPYDSHAIAVIGPKARKLGYINRILAAELAPYIDTGAEVHACVNRLLGDGEDYLWGVEIRLIGVENVPCICKLCYSC